MLKQHILENHKIWKRDEAELLLSRFQNLFFFEPSQDSSDHGKGHFSASNYVARWQDYPCDDFFIALYREPCFAESAIDGLFALSRWDELAIEQNGSLTNASKAAAQWLLERINKRFQSPYSSINVEWIEDKNLQAQHGSNYYAYVEWEILTGNEMSVKLTSRPLDEFGPRFAVEMFLHECRHVYQGAFARIPNNQELRRSYEFKSREYDSPWERDARLYQHLVSTLFYDGSANLDNLERLNALSELRSGWRAFRRTVTDSWDITWDEEHIDRARVALHFLCESGSSNPATAGLVAVASAKLIDAIWLTRAHGIVGGIVGHSKPSQVTCTLTPAYHYYLEACPKYTTETNDPELNAEILVHQAYLTNRLALSKRPKAKIQVKDECIELFRSAALNALSAYELTATTRYLKYVADNISMIAELDDSVYANLRGLAERIYVCGYVLPFVNRCSISYVLEKIEQRIPSLTAMQALRLGRWLYPYKSNEQVNLEIMPLLLESIWTKHPSSNKSWDSSIIPSGMLRDASIGIDAMIRRLSILGIMPKIEGNSSLVLDQLRKENLGAFTLIFVRVMGLAAQFNAVNSAAYTFVVKELQCKKVNRLVRQVRSALYGNYTLLGYLWDKDTLEQSGFEAKSELWGDVK